MKEVMLDVGPIEYTDSGGSGPTLVFLGGLVMPGSVWDPLTKLLTREYRCVVPTLPLGGHRRPMNPDAELTLPGFAAIVAQFLERLDLDAVTLVGNDHAAALALCAEADHSRVSRLVISSCEAFENYPPGLPGKNIRLTAYAPGGVFLAMHAMRLRPLRRLPMSFGWLAKRPLPDELWDEWLRPVQGDRGLRRDLARYARGARRKQMVALCEKLPGFTKPALVVWTPEDKIQRPEHGRRLAETFPDARLVEIDDSYTLIMRDRPEAFAKAIREFVPVGAGR